MNMIHPASFLWNFSFSMLTTAFTKVCIFEKTMLLKNLKS